MVSLICSPVDHYWLVRVRCWSFVYYNAGLVGQTVSHVVGFWGCLVNLMEGKPLNFCESPSQVWWILWNLQPLKFGESYDTEFCGSCLSCPVDHVSLIGMQIGSDSKLQHPHLAIGLLNIWVYWPSFYKPIGSRWVMWSVLCRLPSLSQDDFPGTHIRLGWPRIPSQVYFFDSSLMRYLIHARLRLSDASHVKLAVLMRN